MQKPFYKNPTVVPENTRLNLTLLEIIFNRIFAVLLILATIPLFLNSISIPTIVIYTVFALFLWFGKRYRPFVNLVFLIFAFGIYFIPIIPIGWGFSFVLRGFRFYGFEFNQIDNIFFLSSIIYISCSIRNVFGNVAAYFNPNEYWRNLLYIVSFVIVITTILGYPLLSSIKLRHQAMENTVGNSALSTAITKQELKLVPGKNAGSTRLARRYFTATLDQNSGEYVYRLYLEDPLSESITFTTVETDGRKINFITDNRVRCLNCKKDKNNPFGLVFPAGTNIDFSITSAQRIDAIKFTEMPDTSSEFIFWK